MKRIVPVLPLVLAILAACNPASPEPSTLTVFAAASLTEAFTEIGAAFEASHPGVDVTFNFSGSQVLRTQIEQGAVADVFASGNQREMDALVEGDLVPAGSAQILLTNRLLVILPADNPAHLLTPEDLARPGVTLVLAAEEAPAGRYARQLLENLDALYGAGFRDAVLDNVVSNEENVRQAVMKVQLGEADAAIVFVSDAVAVPGLLTIAIPAEYNVVAEYPIAVLGDAPQPDLAAEFITFVLSPEGQAILEAWGFTPVLP